MVIGELRTRITFQQAVTTTDENDNRISTWTDYYSCWATMSSTGNEVDGEAATRATETVDLTVRNCSEVRAVRSQGFRILLNGQAYDIEYIDPMNNRGKSRRIHAALLRRTDE